MFVLAYRNIGDNEDSNIEAIVDGIGTLWLNEKHTEKLGHKILPAVTNKYDENIKSIDMN